MRNNHVMDSCGNQRGIKTNKREQDRETLLKTYKYDIGTSHHVDDENDDGRDVNNTNGK